MSAKCEHSSTVICSGRVSNFLWPQTLTSILKNTVGNKSRHRRFCSCATTIDGEASAYCMWADACECHTYYLLSFNFYWVYSRDGWVVDGVPVLRQRQARCAREWRRTLCRRSLCHLFATNDNGLALVWLDTVVCSIAFALYSLSVLEQTSSVLLSRHPMAFWFASYRKHLLAFIICIFVHHFFFMNTSWL